MNKFGLLSDEEGDSSSEQDTLTDRLSSFPAVRPRVPIDIQAMDDAAAPHGFVSREATPLQPYAPIQNRRRRSVPTEPTRHLAIRLVSSQYNRFVAYADRYELTYHDALKKLMDTAGE
jgi:hypothetical protein